MSGRRGRARQASCVLVDAVSCRVLRELRHRCIFSRTLCKAGCDSVISYIEADGHDPQLVVKAVEAEGRRCIAAPCDVSSAADVEKFAETALDEFGRIDIAVAMAGILRRTSLEDMTDERFNDMLDIDLVGVLRL